mmetsp:Transcript_24856/g.94005  ORF Transcript_24856/g.94005 Transcript_24856/m.94005 type:complete len:265 (-) Transcript_24856:211-1005(-)
MEPSSLSGRCGAHQPASERVLPSAGPHLVGARHDVELDVDRSVTVQRERLAREAPQSEPVRPCGSAASLRGSGLLLRGGSPERALGTTQVVELCLDGPSQLCRPHAAPDFGPRAHDHHRLGGLDERRRSEELCQGRRALTHAGLAGGVDEDEDGADGGAAKQRRHGVPASRAGVARDVDHSEVGRAGLLAVGAERCDARRRSADLQGGHGARQVPGAEAVQKGGLAGAGGANEDDCGLRRGGRRVGCSIGGRQPGGLSGPRACA